jgi:kynureninase
MCAAKTPSPAAIAATEGNQISMGSFNYDESSIVQKALENVSSERSFAEGMVADDSLAALRDEYLFPPTEAGAEHRTVGSPALYLCGNSLGLQPKAVRAEVNAELDKWSQYGVEGHFKPALPWVTVDETVHEASARIVGALPSEVVIMNSLTTNLHLLMVPFYRPTATRHKIIIEGKSFPSDYVSVPPLRLSPLACETQHFITPTLLQYAVESQIRFHGFQPASSLIEIVPADSSAADGADADPAAAQVLSNERILQVIEEHGDSTALVMIAGVQYYTGQAFDLGAIAAAAHAKGALVGFDCAHAVGNVPIHLHDWGVDFAVWCTYKYLNSGPGSIGGAFVHQAHEGPDNGRPRFAGWWGHQKDDRFVMHHAFNPTPGAFGYQLSNPPVLPMAALRASLSLFDAAGGMSKLRQKSIVLTAYFEWLIRNDDILSKEVDILTPADVSQRGAQLSLVFKRPVKAVQELLSKETVIVDTREPFAMRVAPAPLYNNAIDVWEFTQILKTVLKKLDQ